jgi:preprotein translocase subunit SecG
METILLVVQLVIALLLIGAVLIQRSDSDGFGMGSGSGSNFMTGRAAASLLTRTTAILATLFILNSLALGIIAHNRSSDSIVGTIEAVQEETPVVPVPGEVAKPKADEKVEAKPVKKTDKPGKPAKKETKKPAAAEPSVPVAE